VATDRVLPPRRLSASPLRRGFAPVARKDARVLVLGSLPGEPSLRAGEYYANPRNAFWRIMQELLGIPPKLPYPQRTRMLLERRVALWDVLRASQRKGSLDSAIRRESAVANDIEGFCREHPELRLIAFNGKTAARLFAAEVSPGCDFELPAQVCLPSTSPAHAAMSFAEKCRHWSVVKDALDV
jgi:double-stranded uracil-DNA glycosylase